MKLYFKGAEQFAEGIGELAEELGYIVASEHEADISVSVCQVETDDVEVTLENSRAIISYGNMPIRFFRGLGLLCEALHEGKTSFSKKESPRFISNGSMFDMARNMVMRPEIVKSIMRKQAMMGLGFFMLYLEDIIEVPEYPYFGHMRGRYSKDEIRDMDAYAKLFGIDLVPAIQCLGHLAPGIQWEEMADLRDAIDVLMVDYEGTYRFIDRLMASVKDCFSSKRLHLGLDETDNMGGGRYKEKHELKPMFELFCHHLEKVQELARKYEFETMIWSDMFFYMAAGERYCDNAVFQEEMIKLVPRDTNLVYWSYTIYNPEENEKILKLHYQLCDNVIFAGAFQTWAGPMPICDTSIKSSRHALEACIRNGVKEVMITSWGDGCDGCLITTLYGLMLYAEMDYNGVYDEATIKKRFEFICGFPADDLLDFEMMNHPEGMKGTTDVAIPADTINTSKYLLYNDPLLGLLDKHVEGIDVHSFYENLYEELKDRGPKTGLFAPVFSYLKAIMYVLILKGDYGIRLKAAYDQRDMDALSVLYEESKELETRFEALRATSREFYHFYNKPFGYEVQDMRLGTMRTRFETVRYHIDKLRADSSYRIYELEEERRYLIPQDRPTRMTLLEYDFGRFYSPGLVYKVFVDILLG